MRKDDEHFLHIIALANMYFLLKYTVLLILPYQCITTNGIGHEKLEDVFGYDQPKSGKMSLRRLFVYCLRVLNIMKLLLNA